MAAFSLVQNLVRLPNGRSGGWFGNKFRLDYMGSTEFELGAQHRSLSRMQNSGDFGIHTVQVARKACPKTVFCVAPREGIDRKLSTFVTWAIQDFPRSIDWTYFQELLDEDFRHIARERIPVVAWWSLEDDLIWTLDLKIAEELLDGLEHPAVS